MALWNIHMSLRPPDAVEYLLAQLLVAFINANTAKGKTISLHEVAPWLESPAMREEREHQQDREELSMVLETLPGNKPVEDDE